MLANPTPSPSSSNSLEPLNHDPAMRRTEPMRREEGLTPTLLYCARLSKLFSDDLSKHDGHLASGVQARRRARDEMQRPDTFVRLTVVIPKPDDVIPPILFGETPSIPFVFQAHVPHFTIMSSRSE